MRFNTLLVVSVALVVVVTALVSATLQSGTAEHPQHFRHHHQQQQHKKHNSNKIQKEEEEKEKETSSYRSNVHFTPLDPKVTDPSEFWMPAYNEVPNSYCERPRYPIVPTFGNIAMDILHDLWPNGTISEDTKGVPAKPTNTWLKNLWGFNFSDHENWGGVYPYPYIVQPRSNLVSLMYSGAPRNLTGNRAMQQGFARPGRSPKGNPPIHNASYPYMTMGGAFDFAVQILNGDDPKLAKADTMSAEVDYYSSKKNDTAIGKVYIVKGSPFVTMQFDGAELVFGALKGPFAPIVGMNGLPPGSKSTGTHFYFHIAEGPLHPEAKIWHVFFTSPVTITLPNPPNKPLSVQGRGAGGRYSGLVKFAAGELDDVEASWLKSIQHTVSIGADIEYDLESKKKSSKEADETVLSFKWKTIGSGPVTMLAIPHHLKLLKAAGEATKMNATATKFWCVKGNMTAVTGNTWKLRYNLTRVAFGDHDVIEENKKASVKRAALFDFKRRIDRCPGDNDTYNGTEGIPGYKNMELYAYVRDLSQYTEIAIVLENLGMRSHAVNLTKKVLSCMQPVMKRPERLPYPCPPPINGTLQCVRDMMNIYYDTKWGGLIPGWFDRFAPHYCQCDLPGGPYACRGHNYCDNPRAFDAFADYGAAFYNDHLFQYGYVLRVLSWAIYFQTHKGADLGMNSTVIKNMTTQALAFARDIANPDASKDKYFTYLRHKDPFDGHSWAEGYDYSGRMLTWVNQQSGGEAVNGYFGVYLLGVALNDTNVRDWGRIQMATESYSIHTYQHLTNKTEEEANIPTPLINKWGKVVSILIGNGASGATYYGPNVNFETFITLLPITAYQREWVRPSWAKEAGDWIRWHNNRTGLCVFFDPLNKSMHDNNPCPGLYHNKSFTDNAWGCCGTNEGYPNNQWRAYPEWFPYLYILDAIAGETDKAFSELEYKEFDQPTEHLKFPYVNKFDRIVGYQHDLTLTQALFFVATRKQV